MAQRVRTKPTRQKNGEGSPDSITNYENMSLEERQNILATCCGVISEHTKKMCTRSFRCPQHNDEQRRTVRQFLLNNDNTTAHDHAVEADDVQVDIDSFEDGDVQTLRDSLHWEASPPVDSTSSSNGSRKRGGPSKPLKASVTKKKKVVKQTTPTSTPTASSNHPSNNPVGASLYDFV